MVVGGIGVGAGELDRWHGDRRGVAAEAAVTKGRRAFHNTVCGRHIRLLRRAIARVPNGDVMRREGLGGKAWDTHTGLFLRPRPA